ncbi:MAG: peptidoglycan recognition family protein [Elusimicrobiota bacterium]
MSPLLLALLLPGSSWASISLPSGLEDLSKRMNGATEELAGRVRPAGLPDKGRVHDLCRTAIHEEEMQEALKRVSGLDQDKAKSLLGELEASGFAPEHLGYGMLLSVRSQGFLPKEAVYCNDPEAPEGYLKKWIGVETTDGRRYLLDLTDLSKDGTGLSLIVTHNDKVVAAAFGQGAADLLSDDGLADKVMRAIKGADFRSWFDGSGLLSGLGLSPVPVSASGNSSWTDDPGLPFTPPWRGKVGGAVPAPLASESSEETGGAGSPFLAAFQAFQRKFFPSLLFPVLSRGDWGAAASHGAAVDGAPRLITIHHTAGTQTLSRGQTISEVRGIQSAHQGGNGWADIGYHFLIDGQGRVVEGRRLGQVGAHTEDHNSGNIGISMLGNFDEGKPTSAQVESLKRLVVFLALRYSINPATSLYGHGDFMATDCPGKYFISTLRAMKTDIASRVKSYLDT